MSDFETALAWARSRAAGPQRVSPAEIGSGGSRSGGDRPSGNGPGGDWADGRPAWIDSAQPAGMKRLVEADAAATWLLPMIPEGAAPTVLDEFGLSAVPVEQPNDTARVLAACLRCCWPAGSSSPWPGVAASWAQVTAVFRMITDNRDERVSNIALVAGTRRLAGSGWLRWSPATREVRLGPRVASWSDPELSTLRELWRLIPTVDKSVDKASQAVGNPGDKAVDAVENPVIDAPASTNPASQAVDETPVDDELVERTGVDSRAGAVRAVDKSAVDKSAVDNSAMDVTAKGVDAMEGEGLDG